MLVKVAILIPLDIDVPIHLMANEIKSIFYRYENITNEIKIDDSDTRLNERNNTIRELTPTNANKKMLK